MPLFLVVSVYRNLESILGYIFKCGHSFAVMAKLGSYFGLCPLVDQYTLLGLSKDYEDGHVIVTLGKNIAVKYKVNRRHKTIT